MNERICICMYVALICVLPPPIFRPFPSSVVLGIVWCIVGGRGRGRGRGLLARCIGGC